MFLRNELKKNENHNTLVLRNTNRLKTRRCPEKFCLDEENPWRHKKRIHQLLDNINQNRTNGISHQNQMFKSMI